MRRKTELLDLADQHFPDYKAAREAFAGNSPDVDALKQSAIGIVSKYKGTQLEKAASTLVNTKSDPARIAWARAQFDKAGKLGDWDTISSQALRDVFENARGTVAAGDAAVPAKFRAAVFGSERARDVMKAALGPQRFSDMQGLMEVLEAVSRVPRSQSITHFAGEAAQAEARQAAPVTTFLRNLKLSDPGGELLDALTSRSVEKHRALLAKVITSPDALADLQRMRVLRALSPTSQKRLNAVGIFLAKTVKGGTSGLLSAPDTTLPPQSVER